jgi:hypothetical protein
LLVLWKVEGNPIPPLAWRGDSNYSYCTLRCLLLRTLLGEGIPREAGGGEEVEGKGGEAKAKLGGQAGVTSATGLDRARCATDCDAASSKVSNEMDVDVDVDVDVDMGMDMCVGIDMCMDMLCVCGGVGRTERQRDQPVGEQILQQPDVLSRDARTQRKENRRADESKVEGQLPPDGW